MSEPYEAGAGGAGGTESGRDRGRPARADASHLPDELRALGRSLDDPGTDGDESMVERVLTELLAMEVPAAPSGRRQGIPVPPPGTPGPRERLRALRRWARARRRALTAGLCGVLAVLVLTPPVRAAVVDWFGFGGVEVRYDPSAVPSAGARVPGCPGRSLTLAQAGRRAGFEPLVPGALGVPDAVTVTPEPRGRLLMSLCWREHGRTIQIDAYPARLDIGFTKTVREQPEWLRLGGDEEEFGDPALWFPEPHLLSFWLVDADGHRFTRAERTAGPTLLWTHDGEVTLRLEGVSSRTRALEIAKSLK
ncbi:hypothetical protein [Streptomyces sp. NPDC002685]|uniref:hypothetical protein n=1 Tax=Streptomyces sp. NPDC002685 TaxID=3154540 RepID=UPI0033216749